MTRKIKTSSIPTELSLVVTGLVDYGLPGEQLVGQLLAYLKHPYAHPLILLVIKAAT